MAWRVNLPANISSKGKRERRFFEKRAEAETFCQQQRVRLENFGRNSTLLTPAQQEQASVAFELLRPHSVTLNAVVANYIARHEAKKKSITFEGLFKLYVAANPKMSDSHRTSLKYTVPRFPGLHGRNVCDITPDEIEAEMAGMTPSVRNAFLRNLRAVFNYGVKRDKLAVNPKELM